ncbi:MAG: hypothetical protein FMNOHCHN_03134 [Ignavibacteriaceae bacterium]|nr:hypothetical protein [Ignavibacteriaceae bacterium]
MLGEKMKTKLFLLLFVTVTSLLRGQPNDTYWSSQHWLRTISVDSLWTHAGTYGSSNIIIAVIGMGVEITHEDLAANIWVNNGEVPNNFIDDDDNEFIDDVNGWNFVENSNDVNPDALTSNHSHETKVAGLIAAVRNNSKGISGIAPGCRIMPVKFWSHQSTKEQNFERLPAALLYVRDMQLLFPSKRFIINLSYQLTGISVADSIAVYNALLECHLANIPIFAGPGNDHNDPVRFPANVPFVNSVSELGGGENNDFTVIGSTNRGAENDFAAPGTAQYTTAENNSYLLFDGASMSSPVAAGVAALLLSIKPDLTPDQLTRILRETASQVGGVDYYWNSQLPGQSIELGYGKIDALEATLKGMFDVTFSNNVEGNTTSFGQIKINNTWYPTSTSLPFIVADAIETEAENTLFNYNGYSNRFYSWNYTESAIYDRAFNNSFKAISEYSIINALYKKTKTLTIKNYLEGGSAGLIKFGETGSGSITGDFKDRSSGYQENAFYYNFNQNVKIEYKSEAYNTHSNLFGTNWNFFKWENGSGSTVRQEQINSNTSSEWKAMYKGVSRSDNAAGFSNTSQRKFVRDLAGNLHKVYESMDNVWYELSTNNGSSWSIMNGGAPLGASKSKLPSIDNFGNSVVIVFQEETASGSKISLRTFNLSSGSYYADIYTTLASSVGQYSINANPAVTWGYLRQGIAAYQNGTEGQEGIKFAHFTISEQVPCSLTIHTHDDLGYYPVIETSEYSVTPSVYGDDNGGGQFAVAWEEIDKSNAEYSDIYCMFLKRGSNNTITFHKVFNVSAGRGYTKNSNPSLVTVYINQPDSVRARLSWVGSREIVSEEESFEKGTGTETVTYEYRTMFADPENTANTWVFGNEVDGTNMNITVNGSYQVNGYIISWSEDGGSAVKCINSSLNPNNIKNMGISGKDVQINNSYSGTSSMFGLGFQTPSLPYSFAQSAAISSLGLNKEQNVLISKAREGVILKDTAQFYFSLGDISVDGNEVEFVELSDTAQLHSISDFNQYLQSKPFMMSESKVLQYSVQYGVSDSAEAGSVLGAGEIIRYRVELVESDGGTVLGTFDDVSYTSDYSGRYNNISYVVSAPGMAETSVYLRLIMEDNTGSKYSLSQKYTEPDNIQKRKHRAIQIENGTKPSEYSLSQNYPNPFNPVTEIEFALPEQSDITLKVYDILGKEISTLASGSFSAGRYTIPFDGTSHASGVYIYKLSYGKGQNITRKMTLLK